jgi:exosortase/archaeosortase family protein
MTTATAHVAQRDHTPGAAQTLLKGVLFLAIVGVCVAAVLYEETVRTWEAAISARWLDPVLPGSVTSWRTGYIISESPDGPLKFNITVECTCLVMIIPILVVCGGLLLQRSTRVSRVLLAMLVAVTGLIVVNQLRLGMLAWATQNWGIDPGYEVSHKLVGSILGIAGFALALLVAVKIMGIGKASYRHNRGTR